MPQLSYGPASLTSSEETHEKRSWLDDGMWRNRSKVLGGRVSQKEPPQGHNQSNLDSVGKQTESLSQPGLMLILSLYSSTGNRSRNVVLSWQYAAVIQIHLRISFECTTELQRH